jgi:hypothetical protein
MGPSEKRRKLFNRNVLIILLIALIIVAIAYYIITNPPAEPVNAMSPDDINPTNQGDYIGQTIVVDGYYRAEGDVGEGIITSRLIETGSTFEDYSGSFLRVNHNTEELWNYSFVETSVYRFTGVLNIDPDDPFGTVIILTVEKIEQV